MTIFQKALSVSGLDFGRVVGLFSTHGDPAGEDDGSLPVGSFAFGSDGPHIKTAALGWISLPLVFRADFTDSGGHLTSYLVSPDPFRSNKLLTTYESHASFNGSSVQNGGFLGIVVPDFNQLGFPVPFHATLVGCTGFAKLANGGAVFDLYDGETLVEAGFFDLPVGSDVHNDHFGLNIDLNQGQMVRIKAGGGSSVQDVSVRLHFRWRATVPA